ncbi:hypothetical protein ACFHWD_04350 [Clostridium sp. MT-14]|uniref:hypothetical protein n=1 Tax=Clostridium sp. MT-14 TaxID=3348360 RepID=UPI0035F2B067
MKLIITEKDLNNSHDQKDIEISINDIIEITISNTFVYTGRIIYFDNKTIKLDMSTKFYSKTKSFEFTGISHIKLCLKA